MKRNLTALIGLLVALGGLLLPLEGNVQSLVTVAGASTLMWAALSVITDQFPDLSGDTRWLISVGLAFVIPMGAYLLLVYLGKQAFTPSGAEAAFGVGLAIATGVHRASEKAARNEASKQAVINQVDTFVQPPVPPTN